MWQSLWHRYRTEKVAVLLLKQSKDFGEEFEKRIVRATGTGIKAK
jgi:hypothetical protein